MELREFFKIFKTHKKMFLGIIICFLITGVVYYFVQKDTYKTVFTVSVTRDTSEKKDEYSYDDFYRLQADERFADTIVRWIQSPYIINELFENIDRVESFSSSISAKRLSSQVVDVEFLTYEKDDGEIIAKKLVHLLNGESQKLNKKQKQDNWFIVLGSESVIENNNKSLAFLTSLSLAIGFFVAFWAVMIKHYILSEK